MALKESQTFTAAETYAADLNACRKSLEAAQTSIAQAVTHLGNMAITHADLIAYRDSVVGSGDPLDVSLVTKVNRMDAENSALLATATAANTAISGFDFNA